jgi:hypothetical protein
MVALGGGDDPPGPFLLVEGEKPVQSSSVLE